MKKRLLSALLALSMLCSALPAPAFAQGADSAGLEQEQCSCSIRCTADGTNPDCPVCAADAAACGAGLDPATVETADPEPTPEATATPVPTETPAPAGEPAPQTLGAVPSLLASNDGVSTRAAPTTLTVGGTSVLNGSYWKTNAGGTLTADGASESDYNVKYDKDSNTLTLKDATINGTDTVGYVGAGIYAEGDLTIVLEGSSTVTGVQDPNGDSQSIRVSGNLTIQGGGSLTAQGAETSSGSSYGIFVMGSFTQQGGSVTAIGGNVSGNSTSTGLYVYGGTVTAQDGTLTATGGTTSGSSYGISMSSSSSVTVGSAAVTATGGTGNYSYGLYVNPSPPSVSPSVTLSGSGSLTARSGTATNRAGGIYLVNIWGSTGSVTVGNGSTLLTNSVIRQDIYNTQYPLAPTGDGSWLIYGQSDQTSAVGGNYTLEENLTIESGNTLTIPAGSTLTVPQGKTLTVNGTLNIANQSSLAGEGTLAGDSGTYTMTNPDPVISGSETLTYDGTDHFNDYTLTAPTGTVTVMGKNFAISDTPSLDGWSLETQVIKDAGTYTLTAKNGTRTIEKEVTVEPAEISIASATVQDKTYDGNQDATVTGVEFTGLVNSESLTSGTDYTATAAFTDKSAGENKTATVTVALAGTVKNYTFASGGNTATATARIAPLPVVLTWSTPTSFTYDGSEHSVTAEVSNAVDGDNFNLAYTGNTGTAVNSYTATVTGLGNDNYTLTGASGMEQAWSIVEASIADATVELSETTFTYNGAEQKPAVTVTLNGNALTESDYTVTYSGDCTAAGSYTVTVTGKGNYSGTAKSQPTYTINKAELTITGATLAAKTYDGTTAATVTDVTFTGVQGSGSLTLGEDYTATAVFDDANAGDNKTATVTVTLKNGNYTLVSNTYPLTGQTITKANAAVATVPAVAELTYNGQDQALVTAGTATGGTMMYRLGENGDYTDAVPTGTDAGNYTVYYYVKGDANHNDTTPVSMTVSIAQKAATIAVRLTPANRIYVGDGLPAVGLAYTGLVEGESIAPDSITVDGMPADSNTAKEYALTVSKTTRKEILALEAAENYTITFTDVTLTILEKEVVVLPTEDENRYRLEQSELTVVPEELKDAGFETVDQIKSTMYALAVKTLPGVTAENTALHDVTLLFSEDGGKTWVKADEKNFPASGITVTLPYPDGTNAADYDFVVTHMATVAMNGLGVGEVETPAVTKTEKGLQFTVRSLSPVAVSWSKIETGGSAPAPTAPTATPAAPDGTVYYTCPACGYHDWTATDTGYRCDTCGYVESLKQLAGYGNVKGVYEPKTTGSAAAGTATAAVPQTGDESNPILWLGLLIVSGLALGGIALYRRKKGGATTPDNDKKNGKA